MRERWKSLWEASRTPVRSKTFAKKLEINTTADDLYYESMILIFVN